jgi:dCTP deaminase
MILDSVIGVLPYQEIKQIIGEKIVKSKHDIPDSQIQASSLDLRLTSQAWIVPKGFRPKTGKSVKDSLAEIGAKEMDADKKILMPSPNNRGLAYLFMIDESLELPPELSGHANPKSSAGRIDLDTRLLVDGVPEYDEVPNGYKGPLYTLLEPQFFPILFSAQESLNQIRIYKGARSDIELGNTALLREYKKYNMFYNKEGKPIPLSDIPDYRIRRGLTLTIDLSDEIVAWRAKPSIDPIDIGKKAELNPFDYFEPIYKKDLKNEQLLLIPGEFYLTSTKELVRIPSGLCSEMEAYTKEAGDVLTHEAGFFDEGFGFGKNGEVLGASAVLEQRAVRPTAYHDGQIVAKLVFEYMRNFSEKPYGIGSNYQGQRGIKFAKWFKSPQSPEKS